MNAPVKRRFPRAIAIEAAEEVRALLAPATEPGRLVIAGSLRRGKVEVGDVEIVYVPRIGIEEVGLFRDKVPVNFAEKVIAAMVATGLIAPRLTVDGRQTWGQKNKLAVHVRTGVPIDLFSTSLIAWHNYLVCRTGPAELNARIATLAIEKGWNWAPYEHGFKRVNSVTGANDWHVVKSEEDVFAFVGLPYLPPEQR